MKGFCQLSLCLCVFLGWGVEAQNKEKGGMDFKNREGFLEIVDPIVTQGEREIYKKIPDQEGRRYFEAIFWHKRNPSPSLISNSFRKDFYERRQAVEHQFSTESIAGGDSDRGRTYLLLGPPDTFEERQLPVAGLRPAREETWIYQKVGSFTDLRLRFVYDGVRPDYRLQDKESLEATFEAIRNSQVLDRAEPYTMSVLPLTLPYIGFTKDLENLAATDKHELDFVLNYAFFKGDANRTEVMVGITFRDASSRGMDVNLSAYDPYGEKAREFKKLITPNNGKLELFSVTIEPDQYTIVLRLNDRDGRESVSRIQLDVPTMNSQEPFASSLLLATSLEEVPLYGFRHPKDLVYANVYFPTINDFSQFKGEQLFANQIFYNFTAQPELSWFLDQQPVKAEIVQKAEENGQIRLVTALATGVLSPGRHYLKSVYRDLGGNLVATGTWIQVATSTNPVLDLIGAASTSGALTMTQPADNAITSLDHVSVKTSEGLTIEHLFVFLNGNLILEQDKAPWSVSVDEGLYSVSGKNKITAVAQTQNGLIKVEKDLEPLNIKENYGTRVVQINFNAYDEELNFVSDLDFDKLELTIDGQPQKTREIKKVDEPITFCFLIDTSYSMKPSFDDNISALKKFIESMRPEDMGYFVTFSNQYHQILTPTLSKAILFAVADNLKLDNPNPKFADQLYSENETYLYDGVIASIHSQIQYPGRSVLLMMSDGVGVEGVYRRNGMLSYARENEAVIYSLWLDNNPRVSEEDLKILQKEMTGGERFARKVGLGRFFGGKDAEKALIGDKVRNDSITQGVMRMLSEESGGFQYTIPRDERSLIKDYVDDISAAVGSTFVATVVLPVAKRDYEVAIKSSDEKIAIRNKSKVKLSKTNPLLD